MREPWVLDRAEMSNLDFPRFPFSQRSQACASRHLTRITDIRGGGRYLENAMALLLCAFALAWSRVLPATGQIVLIGSAAILRRGRLSHVSPPKTLFLLFEGRGDDPLDAPHPSLGG